ncbi:hypothetical protein H8S95_16035 [Pontibacter sp. KCTC 32443]|uniref:hypothetical protein n=1 Tax=Pontibacter TaxID=323449 RepID=UPI00164ECFAB|nr:MULTISPECIES: hypothetical protein [Pontibacter]MBC5775587.1 hypothetical protein [Pontibacter sp. KCTC 32443]
MNRTNKSYAKILLAGALSFSFAAEAANITLTETAPMEQQQQGNQGVPALQKELLGPYADINSIAAADLREAYIMLLQSVRERHDTWTDAEWNKAQAISKKLDARRKVVEKDLGTDDKAKIKMLKGELRSLETKKDIKD